IAISELIDSQGIDAEPRAAILSAVRSAPPKALPAWVKVLHKIGGRQETLLLLELGGTQNRDLLEAVHRGDTLERCLWPGIMPFVKQWLDDPAVASIVLASRYRILFDTESGRKLLLAYATDPSRPYELRQDATLLLATTLPGLELLLSETATTPQTLPRPSDSAADWIQRRFHELGQYNGDQLWEELIVVLESLRSQEGPFAPDDHPQVNEADHSPTVDVLRCLRILSGRHDLTTPDEWRRWHQETSPAAVTQREILRLVRGNPDLADGIRSRIVPYQLAGIPEDCVPLYKDLLQADSPLIRYLACEALLRYEDDPEAVPVLIELIDNDALAASIRPDRPVSLLRSRFAVNFFRDTAAWRNWWAKYRKENLRDDTKDTQP
ncbi:MAG: HEAT repeat domain-containing protein, partial [Planctomycetota bacterium]